MATPDFDRCNLAKLDLEPRIAHGGVGEISFARLADSDTLSGACNFIDVAVLPPGVSIGHHCHSPNEEEFYLILEGSGRMDRNGESFRVPPGDLIRNPPGGCHSPVNDGDNPIKIFVFEVAVPA